MDTIVDFEGLEPREGFFVGSRRSEGAIYGSRLSDNEEPAEKYRGRAHRSREPMK